MSNESAALQLAVLIDADNVSHKVADRLFDEVAKLGDTPVRRVYGEFGGLAKGWKDAIVRHAIVPRQQFANLPGKNATDIALVIDAMDLMHAGRLDGFCLVASDSDYSSLAKRLREQGLKVFGLGGSAAAVSLRQTCQQFIVIEMPKPAVAKAKAAPVKVAAPSARKPAKPTDPNVAITSAKDLLLRALARLDSAEWVPLTTLLKEVRAAQPLFTVKAYGVAKPITLVRKTGCFDAELRGGTMMVRRKPATPAITAAAKAA